MLGHSESIEQLRRVDSLLPLQVLWRTELRSLLPGESSQLSPTELLTSQYVPHKWLEPHGPLSKGRIYLISSYSALGINSPQAHLP